MEKTYSYDPNDDKRKTGHEKKQDFPKAPCLTTFRGVDGGWIDKVENSILEGPDSFLKAAESAINSGYLKREDVVTIYYELYKKMPIEDNGSGLPLAVQRKMSVSSIVSPPHPVSDHKTYNTSYLRDRNK